MAHEYAKYEDVDQTQLQKDIDAIKETIGARTQEDLDHVLKLERWGRNFTTSGFLMVIMVIALNSFYEDFSTVLFWEIGVVGAIFIGIGNVAKWANVAHPILHGAYDKVPNVPFKYTKKGFAAGKKRWIHWMDWVEPDAWAFEHNIMHHYHLGEEDDPDNVEKNMVWLHEAKIPMWSKVAFIYIFSTIWKLAYYAPNTIRILANKERIKNKEKPSTEYDLNPFSENGKKLWVTSILPYGIAKFVVVPFLFFPLGGMEAVQYALIFMIISELYANAHSFLVIVPNHSAEDIYQFSTPHKTQGEYYLRQIMGSVNYNTGSDAIDFLHGFLNYQVEHHLFPDMPHSFYQKMQPIVKDICVKHNLEYRQESVFKRIGMTVDLMVGKTKVKRVDGI